MNIVVSIFIIYFTFKIIVGIAKHIDKHWWSYLKKKYHHDDNGNIIAITKLTPLGKGIKEYYREDSSLEKKEYLLDKKTKNNKYILYYPSGKVKYQSFAKLDKSQVRVADNLSCKGFL